MQTSATTTRPTYHAQKEFTFVSQAFAEDTFLVASFTGVEGISRLYEYDIVLAAEDPEIDSRSALQNPATFTTIAADHEFPVHGILARFEQLQEVDETIFYRAVLVPRLWQTSLYHENQLFLDKSVPDIIEELLGQAGLTSNDYELRLTGNYEPWEYICQFRETDFNFISRWMEREGIYYYFEQTDSGDKVVITDRSTSHENISGETSIPYLPPSGQAPTEEDCVHSFTCRQQVLPMRVLLKDYNYRRPTLDLRSEADVDTEAGRGTVYIYGEHFKTPEQGTALARIRAEEFLCGERVFYGESTAASLCPGFLFELTDHYRDSYNQRYLVTELKHEGKSARFLFQTEGEGGSSKPRMGYNNQFTLISAEVQFRAERKSPKPRFYGTMNATIDAAGDGQYAEIDDEGRYKVILPFDQSGNSGGKASRWVRMAQPYAGANYGMHFPLHKGTEVLLTFVDGDPDRPIIAGSVPNPDTMSPVIGGNQSQSMIRTGGGNQIRIEDSDGGQQIHLSSPTQNTKISIGAPNKGNIYECTDGHRVIECGGTDDATFEGPQNYKITQDRTLKVGGKQTVEIGKGLVYNVKSGGEKREITGDRKIIVKGGNENHKVNGDRKIHITGDESRTTDGNAQYYDLGKVSEKFTIGLTNEQYVGAKTSVMVGGNLNISKTWDIKRTSAKGLWTAASIENKAKTNITLTCGDSVISIYPTGISADGESYVTLSASGNEIAIDNRGITLEASKINLKGEVFITKSLHVRGREIKHGDQHNT